MAVSMRLSEWTCYLWDLTQAGDLAGFRVYSEEHRSGLRRLRLQQLQGLVQGLREGEIYGGKKKFLVTLAEAPVSISMTSSAWLGLLSITSLVFSRTLFWICGPSHPWSSSSPSGIPSSRPSSTGRSPQCLSTAERTHVLVPSHRAALEAFEHKDAIYLRHVGDVFLDVLVGVLRTETGAGSQLSSEPDGCKASHSRSTTKLDGGERTSGALGFSSSSSTGMPMDTTRTGSGYVSSKTARRPWIALAFASGASMATSDLLRPADLPRAQGAFSSEIKAQTVGGHRGAPLVCLPQNPPQGEVQDVCGGVVAHDWPTTSLEKPQFSSFVLHLHPLCCRPLEPCTPRRMSALPARRRRKWSPAARRTPDPWSLRRRRRGRSAEPAPWLRPARSLDTQTGRERVFVFGRVVCGGDVLVPQIFNGIDVQHDVVHEATSTAMPFSSAMREVRSRGKPYVSYSSHATHDLPVEDTAPPAEGFEELHLLLVNNVLHHFRVFLQLREGIALKKR
ncbi:hypothetical protein F7725_022515 [Dissostichus mawsoni]|uniref:Uncharacterized protein n=1 Tax=Dissostichus mawsoni TaxID=36200 RepID=A0A7J5YYC0_DISMA|nr:hypothetical protein F7725_022515 [Dissostichus mawsoni]